MNRSWFTIGLMALALTWLGMAQVRAADKQAQEENEEKVSIKQVPPAVRKTLRREAMGEEVQDVDKQKMDGKTVYEVDVTIDGQNYEILVDAKGMLISKKLDVEAEEKAGEQQEKPAKADKEDGEKKDKKSMKEDGDEKATKADRKGLKDKEEDDDEKPAKADKEDGEKKDKKSMKEDEDEKATKADRKGLKDKEEDDDEKPAGKNVQDKEDHEKAAPKHARKQEKEEDDEK